MHQPKVKLLFVLLALMNGLGHALDSDKEQVMHVLSDSANLSQKDHQGIYTGHVQFVQGTTHIHADQAITKISPENKLSLAIVNGSKQAQAHYWSEIDPNKPPLHAYADSIRYYPLRHLIVLTGNAQVKQGNNSFSAAKIIYDTLAQHVVSQGQGKTRTTIILHPEKNQHEHS